MCGTTTNFKCIDSQEGSGAGDGGEAPRAAPQNAGARQGGEEEEEEGGGGGEEEVGMLASKLGA
jgi:hypothetical protein